MAHPVEKLLAALEKVNLEEYSADTNNYQPKDDDFRAVVQCAAEVGPLIQGLAAEVYPGEVVGADDLIPFAIALMGDYVQQNREQIDNLDDILKKIEHLGYFMADHSAELLSKRQQMFQKEKETEYGEGHYTIVTAYSALGALKQLGVDRFQDDEDVQRHIEKIQKHLAQNAVELEEVVSDVFKYPSTEPVKHDGSVTVGDMHGNAIKLTQLLMRYGVVSMDKGSFEKMVKLYGDMESLLSTREVEDLYYAQVKINRNREGGLSRGRQFMHAIKDLKDNPAFLNGIAEKNKGNEGYQNIFECLTEDALNNLENLDTERLDEILKAINDAKQAFDKIGKENQPSDLVPFFGTNRNLNTNMLVDLIKGIKEEREVSAKLDVKKQALKDNIRDFDALLDKIEVKDKSALVRLIGDELADRGSNDYYTLRILERLNKNGVKFNINVSNHSNEFIMSYERRNANSAEADALIGEKTVVNKEQGISLGRLEYLLNEGIVRQEDLDAIIENVYKPSLRIIDYTLTDDGISIFTHAPVQFKVVKCLADKVGVAYDDSSKEALAATIEKINLVVQENYIKENRLSELFAADTHASIEEYPLNHIAWNRWNDVQENDPSDLRPSVVNGFSVDYFHGHDDYQSKKKHVHNLDTESGKFGQAFKQQERLALEEAKGKVWEKFGVKIKGLEEGHSLTEVEVQKRQQAAYEAVWQLVVAGGEDMEKNIQALNEITIEQKEVERLVREIKMLENAAAQYAEKQTTKYFNTEQKLLAPDVVAGLSVGAIRNEFLDKAAQQYFDSPSADNLENLWGIVNRGNQQERRQSKQFVFELAAQRYLNEPSPQKLDNLTMLVKQGNKQEQKQARSIVSGYLKKHQTGDNAPAARQIKATVKSRAVRVKHFFKKKIITPESIENLKREMGNIKVVAQTVGESVAREMGNVVPILRGTLHKISEKMESIQTQMADAKAVRAERKQSEQPKTHPMPDASMINNILPQGSSSGEKRLLEDIRSALTIEAANETVKRLLAQNKKISYTRKDGTEVTKEGANEYSVYNDFLYRVQSALDVVIADMDKRAAEEMIQTTASEQTKDTQTPTISEGGEKSKAEGLREIRDSLSRNLGTVTQTAEQKARNLRGTIVDGAKEVRATAAQVPNPFKKLKDKAKSRKSEKSDQPKTHPMPGLDVINRVLPEGKNNNQNRLLSDIRSAKTVESAQAKITRLLENNDRLIQVRRGDEWFQTDLKQDGNNEYHAENSFLMSIQAGLSSIIKQMDEATVQQSQVERATPVTAQYSKQNQSDSSSTTSNTAKLPEETQKLLSDFITNLDRAIEVLSSNSLGPLATNITLDTVISAYNSKMKPDPLVELPDDFKKISLKGNDLANGRAKLEYLKNGIEEAKNFAETKGTYEEAATYLTAVVARLARESGLDIAVKLAESVEASAKPEEEELVFTATKKPSQ